MMLIAIKPIKRSSDANSTVMQNGLSLLTWRHEYLPKKEGGKVKGLVHTGHPHALPSRIPLPN